MSHPPPVRTTAARRERLLISIQPAGPKPPPSSPSPPHPPQPPSIPPPTPSGVHRGEGRSLMHGYVNNRRDNHLFGKMCTRARAPKHRTAQSHSPLPSSNPTFQTQH